jgi:diguanylate cyclase (GGDEF)-like protein
VAAVTYLTPSYSAVTVVVSVLIAAFASYVALDLARRVRSQDRRIARDAWLAGSVAMGTGIWAMHAVGMLAFSLPIVLGHAKLLTGLSWVVAVGASAVALAIAGRGSPTPRRLAGASLAMGAAICATYGLGIAALGIAPGIVWNPGWLAASAAIAVVAAAVALSIFFLLRKAGDGRRPGHHVAAALVMGLAISGTHYAAMAAASFPEGAVSRSALALSGSDLGTLVAFAVAGLLALTLFISVFDHRLRGRMAQHAASLKQSNAQLQLAIEQLQKQALLDVLTGLPNRLLFEDRLKHALARIARPGVRAQPRLGVLFIDLDGFKAVNDAFEHAAGDAVLKETARRLLLAARDSDTVARVGGDEFLLLMEDLPGLPDAVALARRLVAVLAQPFDIAGRQIAISASVGVVLYPDHGAADKLIAHADAAMDAAKRAGGNTSAVFESRMGSGGPDQLSLQNDLRHAIELNQLTLHYQPKMDGQRGQIRGVEALLRWTHPTRGPVSPVVFIPLAERFGLIGAIGNWVIDEACRQMEAWADDGVRMRVAINLSVHQLREEDLVARIREALRRHAIAPSQLLCEITESIAMEDIATTQGAFDELSQLGVFLSIDDFGTGYSSLSYLRRLPAQQLKIDRSFVNDLESSSDARAIVDAVVHLAHALDLKVVAEGVETAGQRDILLGLGCDELQGYFFARPMTAADLLAWALRRAPDGSADFSASVMQELPAS